MGHAHSHSHDHARAHNHGSGGHAHSHAPKSFDRAFAIGVILNTGFVAIEGGAGFWYGSMALVADAGHNLSDVLSLLIAWAASAASRKPPSERFTYGLKSSSILAAVNCSKTAPSGKSACSIVNDASIAMWPVRYHAI